MANMNFSTNRSGPGVSVFWMIVAAGIAVGAILALALTFLEYDTPEGVAETPPSAMPVGDQPVAEPNIADDTGGAPEMTGDTSVRPNSAGIEDDRAPVSLNDDEATTATDTQATSDGNEITDANSEADDLINDPDTSGSFYPTPSGPEGRDGNPFTAD